MSIAVLCFGDPAQQRRGDTAAWVERTFGSPAQVRQWIVRLTRGSGAVR